jgi:hypothetical protein
MPPSLVTSRGEAMIKAILGIIVTIIAIPIAVLFLLFDYSPNIPIEDYVYLPIEQVIANEIEASTDRLSNGELSIQLNQSTLNQMVYSVIVDEINPAYDPASGCEDDACQYILVEPINESESLAITGMWVRLTDDVISFNVGLRLQGTVPYQTRVRFDFSVIDSADELRITYDRLQVGNIPLPRFIVRPMINAVLSDDAQTQFSTEFFTADIEQLEIVLDKNLFVETQIDDPQLQLLAGLVLEEELVRLEVSGETETIELFFDVAKLVTQKPIETYTPDAEGFMMDLMTQLLSRVTLTLEGITLSDPTLIVSETAVNELLAESLADFDIAALLDQPVIAGLITMQSPWVDLEGTTMVINVPMTFATRTLRMEIVFGSVPSTNGLELQLQQITFGQDDSEPEAEYILIDQSEAAQLLSNFSFENELIRYDQTRQRLVVSTSYLNQQFASSFEALSVDDVRLVNGQLEIDVALNF